MLVKVTNQKDENIKKLDNIHMEATNLMAEYNTGLLMMQVGEQFGEFKDRVKVLINAVQNCTIKLHHKHITIDLLAPRAHGNSTSISSKKRLIKKDSMR
jgi:hypothetical protein